MLTIITAIDLNSHTNPVVPGDRHKPHFTGSNARIKVMTYNAVWILVGNKHLIVKKHKLFSRISRQGGREAYIYI